MKPTNLTEERGRSKRSQSMKASGLTFKKDVSKPTIQDDFNMRRKSVGDPAAQRELILAAARQFVESGAARDFSDHGGSLLMYDSDEPGGNLEECSLRTKRERAKLKAQNIASRMAYSEGGGSSSESEDETWNRKSESSLRRGRFTNPRFTRESFKGLTGSSILKSKTNDSSGSLGSLQSFSAPDLFSDALTDEDLPTQEKSISSQIPMDLMTCITTIETLLEKKNAKYLTFEQKEAIRQLRTASYLRDSQQFRKYKDEFGKLSSINPNPKHNHNRQGNMITRRNAMRESIITKEMQESLNEITFNEQDEDQRQSSHDVLMNYGGMMFENVKHIFKAKKRHIKDRVKKGKLKMSGAGFSGSNIEGDKALPEVRPRVNTIVRKASSRTEHIFPTTETDSTCDETVDIINSLNKKEMISIPGCVPTEKGAPTSYCPPEWMDITYNAKVELTSILSWENISKWDFNILDMVHVLEKERNFCPLLFIGWAIICAPTAQNAMKCSVAGSSAVYDMVGYKIIDIDVTEEKKFDVGDSTFLYNFESQIDVNPEKICNFLREIERRYCADNPYHNNTHAADVTQTLHCLLQYIGGSNIRTIYEPVEIFSVLLAATFHDVAHPGTNNMFQENALTPPAIQYNNMSILESMHSFIGQSVLLGEAKHTDWDIFGNWTLEQIQSSRDIMLKAVLGTDMSKHFSGLEELDDRVKAVQMLFAEINDNEEDKKDEGPPTIISPRPVLEILTETLASSPRNSTMCDCVDDQIVKLRQECKQLAQYILKILLHAADISNPAKPTDLAKYWAECCLAECFAQGDREDELSLPISPLCDRQTVKKADSQISFLQFVIQPTYALVGEVIPRVKKDILPIVEWNLKYWRRMKARMSSTNGLSTLAALNKEEFQEELEELVNDDEE
ncbi:hypothetical protein ACHAXS_010912 [Conticribra weissflogii]